MLMLSVDLRAHRPYLRASAGGQKLFLMVKLLPTPEAANARPNVSIAVVVDTSGSMREPAPGTTPELVEMAPVTVDGKTYNATYRGSSKLDVTMEAARRLVESEHLRPDDRVALIHFDDQADVLASETVGAGRDRLKQAPAAPADHADRLRRLRGELRARGADGFVLMRTDEHGSEYLPGYAERVAWLTGFTGSAAQAAVLPDRPHPQELSAFLGLIGRLAAAVGHPATGLQVVRPQGLPQVAARDLILVGALPLLLLFRTGRARGAMGPVH